MAMPFIANLALIDSRVDNEARIHASEGDIGVMRVFLRFRGD